MLCCAYAGSSKEIATEVDGMVKSLPFEVKIEAENSDVTELPYDDKPRPYACSMCDKRFTRKDNLNRHKRTHTGENSYACSDCRKTFSSQNAMNCHRNIHTGKCRCNYELTQTE